MIEEECWQLCWLYSGDSTNWTKKASLGTLESLVEKLSHVLVALLLWADRSADL